MSNGAAFLKYLETEEIDFRRPLVGPALAYLHMGRLTEAKRGFDAHLAEVDATSEDFKDLLPDVRPGEGFSPNEAVERIREIRGRRVVIPQRRNVKAKIKPVLNGAPDLVFDRGVLLFKPIGYYLRGCTFYIPPGGTYILMDRFVCPLFEGFDPPLHLGWGVAWGTHDGFSRMGLRQHSSELFPPTSITVLHT